MSVEVVLESYINFNSTASVMHCVKCYASCPVRSDAARLPVMQLQIKEIPRASDVRGRVHFFVLGLLLFYSRPSLHSASSDFFSDFFSFFTFLVDLLILLFLDVLVLYLIPFCSLLVN